MRAKEKTEMPYNYSSELSGYRAMWLFAMFDLPMDTKEARKEYTRFRKKLLGLGFTQIQLSVYARFFPSEEASDVQRKKIAGAVPPDGLVRLVAITDRQFGKMESYYGKEKVPPEKPPSQLAFF